jgi:hypothetical protein
MHGIHLLGKTNKMSINEDSELLHIPTRTNVCKNHITVLILCVIILSAIACALGIGIGYVMWPSINGGCQEYNCTWIVSGTDSYCDGTKCTYYWNVVVQGIVSWWVWGMQIDGCNGGCASGGYTSNTTIPPYSNNTLCYEPPYCKKYIDIPWIRGWNCLPIFQCINRDRIIGRLWYIYTTSIVLGLIHLGGIIWLFCRNTIKNCCW